MVKACASVHYSRKFPTYYIKAKGEVDIAYVDNKRFWPVEVKWTAQLGPKKLKQIAKYNNSVILTRSNQAGEINGIPSIPLPMLVLENDR